MNAITVPGTLRDSLVLLKSGDPARINLPVRFRTSRALRRAFHNGAYAALIESGRKQLMS
jgi:hypothetical protein